MNEDNGYLDAQVERLTLEPDDIIVVTFPYRITASAADSAAKRVEAKVGTNHPVLILGGGSSMHILRPTVQAGRCTCTPIDPTPHHMGGVSMEPGCPVHDAPIPARPSDG